MSSRPSLEDPGVRELEDQIALRRDVLDPDVWDRVVATMQRHEPLARAAITLRDGPNHYRIYVISRGPGYDFAPFQQRLPVLPHTDEVVYRRGEPYVCDDTRKGTVVEQMIAAAGYLSYTLVPMKGPGGEVFGDVLFAFEAPGGVRSASLPRLVTFAAVLARVIPEALAELRAHRLARILDQSQEALLAWDSEGTVTEVNGAAERLFGRPRAELIGARAEELLGAGALEPLATTTRRQTLLRPDGSRVVVAASFAQGDRDPLVAGHALMRDVSDVVLAEERLVQGDRLATIGMLAAGVAHEINNPAAFLLLGIELVRRRLQSVKDVAPAPVAEIQGLLGELKESTQRIVTIARDLRQFASPGGGVPIPVDVARAVDSALSLVRAQILERADLEVDVGTSLPPVLLGEGELSQVIVNLLLNAVEAIPKGLGRAVVRVDARQEGTALVLQVRDTGPGIPPDVLDRMWTPFFTTKEQGQGTGLGLSISRGIVERAGGHLVARNGSELREGAVGACFVITLPVAGAQAEVASSSAPPPPSSTARRAVLLVEDEPALARVLVEQIGARHEVTLVTRGDDAVRLLVTRRFDVVLCDLRMPGLSGEAVYQRVAARDPAQAQRFVFMTGVGFGDETERFLKATGVPVLEKPFALEDALRAVSRVTARTFPPAPAGGGTSR